MPNRGLQRLQFFRNNGALHTLAGEMVGLNLQLAIDVPVRMLES